MIGKSSFEDRAAVIMIVSHTVIRTLFLIKIFRLIDFLNDQDNGDSGAK